MKLRLRAFLTMGLILWLLVNPLTMLTGQMAAMPLPGNDQELLAHQKAVDMLNKLTPEERVGQLFVVTFTGAAVDERSQVYDLIAHQHVGGLMLLRSNDNFNNTTDVRSQSYDLTVTLQNMEWNASQNGTEKTAIPQLTPIAPSQYIPLFIGVSQEGNSAPYDQLLSGATSLPSLMSIGATWDTTLSRQVGQVMGEELSALGFNLILGPSLDVLSPSSMSSDGNNLGVRSFGGDPYWVSKMGQAYIAGLHTGSNNHLAVIARHFPGGGSSDRSPEEEIATVRKSLEQLKTMELYPFFAVTGKATTVDSLSDGVLVSHIRYQGFQSNIRATTRPVSLDTSALEMILNLPEFSVWRQNGGLTVSDDLGSPALKRFYESSGTFDPTQVAREAFYAGNDLLYINRMQGANDPDVYTTTVHTLQFFTQKYRSDPEFARRVDAAVLRILMLKYRLYPTFDLNQVLPDTQAWMQVGNSAAAQKVVRDVARQSVTLISPDANELLNVLPQPPGLHNRMVYITDVQAVAQCSTCVEQVSLPADGLQRAVLNLYGANATGQVSHTSMSSYSFTDLMKMLNQNAADAAGANKNQAGAGGTSSTPAPVTLEDDLKRADWVVISMLEPDSGAPDTLAFKRLLREQPQKLRDKKVIVFAFDAPYAMDATDISKITAYYALYSKTSPFIDVAARVLFQEMLPSGALPISVPGAGYDLIWATSPDPVQNIPLTVDSTVASALGTATPIPATTIESTPSLQTYGLKDIISLRTGVIYDHHHKPVPDDTPVSFLITVTTSTGTFNQQVDKVTTDGIARFSYRIDQAGVIDIHATSGGARSDSVHLDVSRGEAVPTFVVQPTQSPIPPTSTPQPTVTITATASPQPTAVPLPPPPSVQVKDWLFAVILLSILTAAVTWWGIRREITRWGLRWALCGLIGGLVAYNYLALGLPGTVSLLQQMGSEGVLIVTFLGISAGWMVGMAWRQFSPKSAARGSTLADRIITGDRKTITGPKQ